MQLSTTAHVQWFRQASPYINAHRGKTFVIMLEGEAILHPNFTHLVQDIALLNSLGVQLVLVHGARPQIDSALTALNIRSHFHNDLRITDDQALTAVKAAIGMVKADIESLFSVGLPNSPLHGARIRVVSGNFVTAKPIGVIDGVDLQHTGEVRRIEAHAIHALLSQGNVVLLSCCGYSPSGEMFNLSVEEVAQSAAVSLRADKLIILGKNAGVLDAQGDTIEDLTTDQAEQALPHLKGESFYHTQAAIKALRHGVPRVHLLSHEEDCSLLQELFTREGHGTLISLQAYDQLRRATLDDINGIIELLRPLEEQGVLVKRSRELLEREIEQFFVIERDGLITACAALYPYSATQAELACVAVHPKYRSSGRGAQLLEQIEAQAQHMQLHQLFVLTTRTAHWFIEHGFHPGMINDLPEAKQSLYNLQRNSKIFFKQLG